MDNENDTEMINKIYNILLAFNKTARQVAFLTFFLSIPYILIYCCINSTEECLKTLGSVIPVLVLASTIIIEVKEEIRMWASIRWERLKQKRRKHQERKFQRGLELGMQIANEKYLEWIEWIENGRDESNKPSPPEHPEELAIFITEEELE